LQFGVTKLGLFGSTVRGENKPGSDIDVLIDFQVQEMQEKTNYTS
jgi:predicted nucleotidyltransferase